MTAKRVLSVGQCLADGPRIAHTLRQAFDAQTTHVADADEAVTTLRQAPFDLVLINRVFDADGGSGLDLIRRLQGDQELKATPVMLVSNFDDAQAEAVKAGAAPGFGKAALGRPQMLARVAPYLGEASRPSRMLRAGGTASCPRV
jgi:PleD family two-component response regulator